MTKKELIKALEPFPDNMDIFIGPRVSEFEYGYLNEVTQKRICYKQDPSDEKCLSKDQAIVLNEF